MGVLNVTPDSFSDGGRYRTVSEAIAHGEALAEAGAGIIDVGGESTRPGARPVTAREERSRVLAVVEGLATAGVTVSIDTVHASTAAAAAAAGAAFVNDVSGGLADPAMAATVARTGLTYVIGHWRGTPRTMNDHAVYRDPVVEVSGELAERVASALAAGVRRDRIVLDPGLGFAKLPVHNWQLLGQLGRLQDLGYPVMVGASRKRFLADLLPGDSLMGDRDLPTAVLSVLAAQYRVWAVRVHQVEMTRVALSVLDAWVHAHPAGAGGVGRHPAFRGSASPHPAGGPGSA
ncbi:dihydropteroate synthase [Streptomyces sp. NPDC055078]